MWVECSEFGKFVWSQQQPRWDLLEARSSLSSHVVLKPGHYERQWGGNIFLWNVRLKARKIEIPTRLSSATNTTVLHKEKVTTWRGWWCKGMFKEEELLADRRRWDCLIRRCNQPIPAIMTCWEQRTDHSGKFLKTISKIMTLSHNETIGKRERETDRQIDRSTSGKNLRLQ